MPLSGPEAMPKSGGTFTGDVSVPDEAYDATAWDGSVEVPTKNAIRDKFETIFSGGASAASAGRVDTVETTTSTSFTDLATAGPAVTLTTGSTAIVHISSYLDNNNASGISIAGFAVSGATTVAAADTYSVSHQGTNTSEFGRTFLVTGLTPGSNTFTMKYRAASGTAEFARRVIVVQP